MYGDVYIFERKKFGFKILDMIFRSDFTMLPFQAVEAYLANVIPLKGLLILLHIYSSLSIG